MLSKEQKAYITEIVNKAETQDVGTFTRSFLHDGIETVISDIDFTIDLLFRLGVLVKVSPRKFTFDKHALANIGQLSSKQNRWMEVIETNFSSGEFMMSKLAPYLTEEEIPWSPVILEELSKLEYIEKVSERKYVLSKTRENEEEDSKRISMGELLTLNCLCGCDTVQLLNTFYKKSANPVTLLCRNCSRSYSYPQGSEVYKYVASLL